MVDRAVIFQQHDFFAAADRRREARSLESQAGEVGREAVKIVLAVFFERVMVAPGAFQTNAEKELTDERRRFRRIAAVAEQYRRPILKRRALGRHQLADEL